MSITLEAAKQLLAAAQKQAARVNKPITVAIVDAGGYTILVERMDGSRPLTPDIAIAKAYTAAVMQRPSAMLKGWAEGEPVFFTQVAGMGHRPIVATMGGVPIKKQGVLIGGLGIAGGVAEEDQKVCEAALADAGYEADFVDFNRLKK